MNEKGIMKFKYRSIKKRIYEILEKAEEGDRASRTFDIFISIVIISNILAVIFGTVENIRKTIPIFLYQFEIISVMIFSIEYVLRIWTCTENPKYHHWFIGRIKYVFSFIALVDFFAILPFYLPFIKSLDLRFIRAFRLFRLFRIFKLGRYSKALSTVGDVLKERKEELSVTFTVVVILLILSSSVMFYVEHESQPDVFTSIPATFWWAVATLTTVGYGDIYPVTILGKILGGVIAILGIGMFALPTGILGAGFVERIKMTKKEKEVKCPNCGKVFNIQEGEE